MPLSPRTAAPRARHPTDQNGERPAKPKAPSPLYDHWCPVCQSSRVGRRPVKAWRCAACVAAGLDGKLEITRPLPFCFPAEGRIAFEDRLTRAFWDAFPVSEGHLLIVPRRHVPTWFDASEEERAAITRAIDRGRELIESRH